MFATWINGTLSGALNTLKSRDLTENTSMMGKSPRTTQDTKGPLLHGNTHKNTHLVSSSIPSASSSFHTATQKALTSLPLLSSSPSLTTSSLSHSTSPINPLQLFTAVDLELDSLSIHHEGGGDTESSTSFPSLSKLSIPTSPLLQYQSSVLSPLEGESASEAMEQTEEHTGGSSKQERGEGASSIQLNWAPVPNDWTTEEHALIAKLGLEKYVNICREKDEAVAKEAISNYNPTTKKTQVQGLTLELNAETVAKAFDFVSKPGKKESKLSDVAISKHLNETEVELQDRKTKKQGITCSKIPQGRVYRFIAEAIAMKGTSTYISETMFGKFLGKATLGYHMDVAREVTEATSQQMEKFKNKSQKLLKCGHVFVGLYKQALSLPSATSPPDISSPSKTMKPAAPANGSQKRKGEQVPEAQISKKSKSTSTSLSTDTKKGVDALETIMEKKRKERELKLLTLS